MSVALIFALVLMGFTFTITQVMVIRELLVVFAGNELSIAIILANWLLLEAAGSFLIGKKVEEWAWREPGYALAQFLIALLLPLTIYGIRCLRYISGLSPGEGASLLQIFFWTLPLLAPLGILDGILFALGCTLHSQSTARTPASIGRVYLLEALGAGLGGVLYTFLWTPLFNSFQVAFLLGAANLLSGLLLILRPEVEKKKKVVLGGLGSFFLIAELALLTLSGSQTIEKSSMKRLWPGLEILQSRWSPYGNVTVGRREEQLTFFSNGIPICNAPVPDIAFVEELVHYPLLLLPSPQKVLIVGGGFGGVLHEVLKHPVSEIHYAEIDPLIIQLIKENLTPLTRGEMEDPRVEVHPLDGRFFIKTTSRKFDAVLLNLPVPSTLETNRFYTVDFFREVFRILKEDGILTLSTPGSETYLGPEARDLNGTVLQALRRVFPSVSVIPGESNFLLASPSKDLGPLTLERFITRLQRSKIKTQFLTEFHIQRKLETRRSKWLEESLSAGRPVRLNQDANPSGLYYGIAYWNAQFYPPIQRFWSRMGDLRLWHMALFLGLCLFGAHLWRKISGKTMTRGPILGVVVTTGFFGTAMSILLIFSFQTLYGYTYQWIGLLVAFFMVGLALGSYLMTRSIEKIQSLHRALIGVEALILLSCALSGLLFGLLYSAPAEVFGFQGIRVGFLAISLLSGFWVGFEFPLCSRAMTRNGKSVGRPAGILYASDLIGAWLGALLVGVILVPILGIFQTCAAILLLKAASFVFLAKSLWRERAD